MEEKDKITIYKLETGMLLEREDNQYNNYNKVYDRKRGYYDYEYLGFLSENEAKEFAMYDVKQNGVVNTYFIISKVDYYKDEISDEQVNKIKNDPHYFYDNFEPKADFYLPENVVFSGYKNSNNEIVEDFVINLPIKEYDYPFLTEKDKLEDMINLSKKEFLDSYSYITEKAYDNTKEQLIDIIDQIYERRTIVNLEAEVENYLYNADIEFDNMTNEEYHNYIQKIAGNLAADINYQLEIQEGLYDFIQNEVGDTEEYKDFIKELEESEEL